MAPLIGIIPSCDYENGAYSYTVREINIAAVADAGGQPLVLPYRREEKDLEAVLKLLDGLYFTGGCDILPEYFGESPRPGLGALCPARDEFEIRVYRLAARRGMPMLGVCRGMQIINVAAGGTVYQDLTSQLPEAGSHKPQGLDRALPYHKVSLAADSRLAGLFPGKNELFVNSFHHESVWQVAPGFTATAWAPDGVIEAMESTGPAFCLAVQWHPEDMYRSAPEFGRLYQTFIAAAADYQKKK